MSSYNLTYKTIQNKCTIYTTYLRLKNLIAYVKK